MRKLVFLALSIFVLTACGSTKDAPKKKSDQATTTVKKPQPKAAAPKATAPKAAAPKAAAPKAAAPKAGKLATLTVDDVKAVAKAAGYRVRKVNKLAPQLGIKTTVISLSKTTVVSLNYFPKNSPYIDKSAKDTALDTNAREGDFILTVRGPAKKSSARKKLLAKLREAAEKK